jgi:hypothetical protein
VNRWEQISLQEMVVTICLLTTAPPDREQNCTHAFASSRPWLQPP